MRALWVHDDACLVVITWSAPISWQPTPARHHANGNTIIGRGRISVTNKAILDLKTAMESSQSALLVGLKRIKNHFDVTWTLMNLSHAPHTSSRSSQKSTCYPSEWTHGEHVEPMVNMLNPWWTHGWICSENLHRSTCFQIKSNHYFRMNPWWTCWTHGEPMGESALKIYVRVSKSNRINEITTSEWTHGEHVEPMVESALNIRMCFHFANVKMSASFDGLI